MKLRFFGMKASTLCVAGSLLMFGGFVSVNLAGCGGGGGGGSSLSNKVTVTLRLVTQSGDAAQNAVVTFLRNGNQIASVQADSSGVAPLNLSPGTYTYELTLEGETIPSTGTVTILALNNQSYTLYEGDNNNFPYRVSGTVFLNPSGLDDPDGNDNTPNCTATSDAVSAPITIYVRDLDVSKGQPIIATFTRGTSVSGGYSITLPYRPTTFQVEVTQASDSGDQFAGIGPQTAFPTNLDSLSNINICANASSTVPVASTATPTATPTSTATPTPTP